MVSSALYGENKVMVDLLSFNKDKVYESCKEIIKDSCVIKEYIVTVDNGVDVAELYALAPFKKEDVLTVSNLVLFLQYIEKKKRFKQATISIESQDDKVVLKIFFKGAWVFNDLKIHGISLGKDRYRKFYKEISGDIFLLEDHRSSLEDIKLALKKKGRCGATLTDHFSYQGSTKSIKVHAAIKKGDPFKIDAVELLFFDQDQKVVLVDKYQGLYKDYCAGLIRKKYDEDLIEKRLNAFKNRLILEGFSEVSLQTQETINYEKSTVQLQIIVTVGTQHIRTFIGNKFFTAVELLERIRLFGDSVGIVPVTLIAQDIKNEYRKNGFLHATVQTREDGNNHYFIIDEGQRTFLKECVFKESTLDQKIIHDIVGTSLLINKPYKESVLKNGTDRLIQWYHDNGFIDAYILKKNVEEYENQHVKVTITVHEGPCYTYAENIKCTVEGDCLLDSLNNSFLFKIKGAPFSYQDLQKQRAFITQLFKKEGYLYVSCMPNIEKNAHSITVLWTIVPGKKIYVGKTVIRGVTSLSYKRLMQEVAYKEDDVWDITRLYITQESLQAMGMFKQVSVYPDHEDIHRNGGIERTTIIQLQEEDAFEVKVRFGMQQMSKNLGFKKGSTYKVGGSVLWRNPTNNADQLCIEADGTAFEQKYGFWYLFPRAFGVPVTVTLKGYSNLYAQPVALGHKATLYDIIQQGFLISLTNTRSSYINTGCNVGLEVMALRNISNSLASVIAFNPGLIRKKIPYFFIEPNIFIDQLDDKLNPKNGFFAVLSCKGMFPFKESSSLVKVTAEHAFFHQFFKKFVLGTRIRLGHIFKESFEKIMPSERFFLGGPHSIRAYQSDGCPPLGSFIDQNGITQWVPQGGKTMINLNFEVRFPLLVPPLQGVVFQDFGMLSTDVTQSTILSQSIASTGFGFRYLTPIGPLRFDIGWKWKRAYPSDSRYGWCLTFGHAF